VAPTPPCDPQRGKIEEGVAHLPAGQSEQLQAAFNEVRRDEYLELLQRCQRFLAHVQRVAEAAELTFSVVEELEEDLEKRRRSLAQIVARDAFAIDERLQVEASIKECESALEAFVEQVFIASRIADDNIQL
jgi:hypothetical protein